jgi:quinoprotein glucose dehydrogenase
MYKPFRCFLLILTCILLSISCKNHEGRQSTNYTTWSSYLGGSDRNHYTTLAQITPENLKDLEIAWTYTSPDSGQMQMSSIIIDSLLYGVTAGRRAFAVHAETGKEIWRFGDSINRPKAVSRGVSYWKNGTDQRIFHTIGSKLYALNALTGKAMTGFGENGSVDLRSGMPEIAKEKFVGSNTPGTIYNDKIIMPLHMSEGAGAAPGNIMAFNVITGKLEWVFHTIPYPDEPGFETWENKEAYKNEYIGAANNWAGMSLDEETGILYIPTGSAAPDFYGGLRKGDNLYANCLLAIEAETGKLLWYFQFTHHDLWDRDAPAPPNLITITRKGVKIPAVAQVTKQGYVFVFDRKTGEPLFDIEERKVPASNLAGELASETQPFPLNPAPFARFSTELTEDDVSPYAENKEEIRAMLQSAEKRLYAPPDLTPTILFPGYDGAAEWGGSGADPDEGILYVNANEMAWILQMEIKKRIPTNLPMGEQNFQQYCMVCHQQDRKGIVTSGIPSLIGLKDRLKKEEVAQLIAAGKNRMPGFPQIGGKEKETLLDYLFEEVKNQSVSADKNSVKYDPIPYKFKGYKKFLDSNGLPAISPPWGSLHAIDLNTGNYKWSVVFGETNDLKEKGFPQTGSENYGGPVITENGLLFIGATKDGYFRAYDKHTGNVLWEYLLPAPAFATPATYQINGKQYIAIACGGEKLGTPKGNKIIAFALK